MSDDFLLWLGVVAVSGAIGLFVGGISTAYTSRTRRRLRHQRLAGFMSGPAVAPPERTGAYLQGRVERLIEGVAVVALTGPGNGGQRLTIPDTGQYVVGDRVTVYEYADGTWRPSVVGPSWDRVTS